MPSDESGGNGNFWYSWDYGMVHFITIDSETDLLVGLQSPDEVGGYGAGANSGPFGAPNQQIQWLEYDLASVDRKKTPWIVVGFHRPWYIAASNDSSSVCLDCQKAFEPLFVKYGVDLYMSGHVHVSPVSFGAPGSEQSTSYTSAINLWPIVCIIRGFALLTLISLRFR